MLLFIVSSIILNTLSKLLTVLFFGYQQKITITTSKKESEYTALSITLWSSIPLFFIIKCATKGLIFIKLKLLTFKFTVHEDNMGDIALTKL